MHHEYVTMKEIGQIFGMTSHKVGSALKAMGLRNRDGKPSDRAHQEKLVRQKWTEDGANYLWAWHVDKTVAFLVEAGHETKTPAP
jgi:hypothetical protein